jgi:DNA-binding MarR family transcriptional regulator
MPDRSKAIVTALALLHYRNELSSARLKRIAVETDYSPQELTPAVRELREYGIVETVGTNGETTSDRYRLVAPAEFVPYRAGGD